jgi:hypothetical protein
MEILRVPVKESHSRAYSCAQRKGAKFGTLTEAYRFIVLIHFRKLCPLPPAHASYGRPGRNFATPSAHGKAKTHMAGSLPFLHYTLSHSIEKIASETSELPMPVWMTKTGNCLLPPGTISSAWTRER